MTAVRADIVNGRILAGLLGLLLAGSCVADDGDQTEAATTSSAIEDPDAADQALYAKRIDELQVAVSSWRNAESIEEAHAGAEAAANLVVGPGGPDFGDRDGDGVVGGSSDRGLLTGVGGVPAGIAEPLASVSCVTRDVLGATAEDVDAGWVEMESAIDAWRPDDNTMPTLASHPMRVVGWATFTLDTSSLADAHEFASHAQLHVDVASDALTC